MERIYYAADSLLTGTDIARALVLYAEALAKVGSSASVDIPTRLDDGGVGSAMFLIGPASQLVSESVESDYPELINVELVEKLTRETLLLGDAHPQTADQDDFSGGADILDFPDRS
jgi:hypothetical protein